MAQLSMSPSSFLVVGSHGHHPHLVELLTIVSKHVRHRLAATVEDRPNPIMDPLVVQDIALRHPPEEAHHQGGTEVVHPQGIVILTLTGRAHFPVRGHREHAHGLILPDQGPGLPHVETESMDVGTAHRHQGEEGEEGVLAIQAFLAIAIAAVAGVEVGTDVGGVDVLVLSPLVRSSVIASELPLGIGDIILAHHWRHPRSRSQIIGHT